MAIACAAVIFAALSIASAITSEGFLEADGCSHFLMARFALREWHYLVNVWGRPVCTAIYALPASLGSSQAGLIAVRFTSLLMCLAMATITWRIAKNQGYRYPALAFVFVLAQPLLFFHSFSELTEVPFALLAACGLWAYQRRQFVLVALIAGWLPLARPEGFGFLALAGAALVAHRRYASLPLLMIPLVLWNHAGWMLYGQEGPWWRWLPANWPYAADSLYDPGSLLHFVALLPVIISPLVFPAMWIGAWRCFVDSGAWIVLVRLIAGLRRRSVEQWQRAATAWLALTHLHRVQVIIVLIPMMVLAGHSVLYWLGKMASNGELRYLLVVAPFWGLLSARGWEWVFERMQWRRPMLWAGIAALAPVLTHFAYPVIPLRMDRNWQEARLIANWYRDSGLAQTYPKVMAAHPGIWYFMDRSPSGRAGRQWHWRTVAEAPAGTLLIWDPVYGVHNSDQNRSISLEAIVRSGWVPYPAGEIAALGETTNGQWHVFLSPKTATGQTTTLGDSVSDVPGTE